MSSSFHGATLFLSNLLNLTTNLSLAVGTWLAPRGPAEDGARPAQRLPPVAKDGGGPQVMVHGHAQLVLDTTCK